MDASRVLVALAVTLALGCGDEQLGVDAGADLGRSPDEGVVVVDAGVDAQLDAEVDDDAGWCVDSPCVQRLRFDGTCVEDVREDFPCDDEDERTYDDRCDVEGVCGGTACECDTTADPCCDGCNTLPIGTTCEWGHPYPAGTCILVQGESRVRCSITP